VHVERLDQVFGQLDGGLEYFRQDVPELDEDEVQTRKGQHEELGAILSEENRKTVEFLTCTFPESAALFDLLTPTDAHRIPLDICVCTPDPVPIVDRPSLHHSYLDTCRAVIIRPTL